MARWSHICLLGIVAVPLAVFGYDRCQRLCWVGSTDLQIEFFVTDAATGNPLENAEVVVVSEGAFYKEREEKELTLKTDEGGIARRICHDNMCSGTESGLRLTNSYVVRLPDWYYSVRAPGYTTSNLVNLAEQDNQSRVERLGPNNARLVVHVSMTRPGN